MGRPPEIPQGWFEIFSWESHPIQVRLDRTARNAIRHALHDEACRSGEADLLLKMQARSPRPTW